MGRDRSINVFAGFTRDFAPITNRFDDASQNSTVLAPLNSAIEALPRKPWEDPADYHTLGADAYEGPGGQERAQQNLRRFVEAHIVPVSPWPEKYKASAMAGAGEIWWEMKDGKRLIQPGNIEVASVASTVANGQVVSADLVTVLFFFCLNADLTSSGSSRVCATTHRSADGLTPHTAAAAR